MSIVLNDCVALIPASVLGQLDAVDVAEGTEPLADLALRDLVQHVDKAAYVDLRLVVLLILLGAAGPS